MTMVTSRAIPSMGGCRRGLKATPRRPCAMRDRGAMTNARGTPMSDAPRRKYRRILLQIDSSTHSRHTMVAAIEIAARLRSEEHTSELQSRENIVCRLLLGETTT